MALALVEHALAVRSPDSMLTEPGRTTIGFRALDSTLRAGTEEDRRNCSSRTHFATSACLFWVGSL